MCLHFQGQGWKLRDPRAGLQLDRTRGGWLFQRCRSTHFQTLPAYLQKTHWSIVFVRFPSSSINDSNNKSVFIFILWFWSSPLWKVFSQSYILRKGFRFCRLRDSSHAFVRCNCRLQVCRQALCPLARRTPLSLSGCHFETTSVQLTSCN